MATHTYINKRGLQVLERVIGEGNLQFAGADATTPYFWQTPEERLIQLSRSVYIKDSPLMPQLPAIPAAEHLLRVQWSEDRWRMSSEKTRGIEGTWDYVVMALEKSREKSERLGDVRCLLAALMQEQISEANFKHVSALLGETFILEDNYESALFWLELAVGCPYFATQSMLEKAQDKVASTRRCGFAPAIRKFRRGYRYRPLAQWEKVQIRKRRNRITKEARTAS